MRFTCRAGRFYDARGTMNKTHLTYLLMIAIFAGGLWGILRLGSGLRAARNVSGEWQLLWTDAARGEGLPDRMTIDQSGRYLTATMKGPVVPVRLSGRISGGAQSAAKLSLSDSKSSWKLAARLDENQLLTGSLETPSPHPLRARRVPSQP